MKAKEISDEGLAAILRAIAFTGHLTINEKEYIREAADRLEEKGTEDDQDDLRGFDGDLFYSDFDNKHYREQILRT